MLGFARLNRGKILVETMPSVWHRHWEVFLESLKLDEPVEFGEGDVGVAGGIRMLEPANANITAVDMIKRYGGTTSPSAQWPEEAETDEDDRFERVEKLIEKAVKRMTARKKEKTAKSSGGGSSEQELSTPLDLSNSLENSTTET